jgi:hypothetical protein
MVSVGYLSLSSSTFTDDWATAVSFFFGGMRFLMNKFPPDGNGFYFLLFCLGIGLLNASSMRAVDGPCYFFDVVRVIYGVISTYFGY